MKNEIRSLHLDVMGIQERVGIRLADLNDKLENLLEDKEMIQPTEMNSHMSLSSEAEYNMKLNEMLGEKLDFRVAQFDPKYDGRDSAIAAEFIARNIPQDERCVINDGRRIVIDLKSRPLVEFNNMGRIVYSSLPELIGHDPLHYISCNIHQDFGVVMLKPSGLVYTFDSAMFEKTPKDVDTGHNNFVGRNIIEFHGKGKNFGNMLPDLFRNLVDCFAKDKIDMLTIDLKGANMYSDGKITVQRFERDYVVPIISSGFKGIVVYTDVFFQNIREKRTPYEGGSSLRIEDPAEFHKQFKVIRNGT